jgi:protein phosphatase
MVEPTTSDNGPALPEPLEVGDEVSHDEVLYRVVDVEPATAHERRYRVVRDGSPDEPLWLRHRLAGQARAFAVEVNFLSRLHEPRRVHLFPVVVDQFEVDEGRFLLLDRVFGESLGEARDALRDDLERRGQELALTLEQALLAVSKVHRAGFVVTDLTPESFVRAGDGRVQLVHLSAMTRRGTAPKQLHRTPYTAPELETGVLVDERVDLWAMGAILASILFEEPLDDDRDIARYVQQQGLIRPVFTQLLQGSLTGREERFLTVDEMRILVYQLKNELARFTRPAAAMSSTVGISRHRYINEDSAGFQEVSVQYQSRPQHLGFYCVADGMGGHELGERASQLSVLGALQAFRQISQEIPFDRLREGLAAFALTVGRAASEVVCGGAAQLPGGARMGTTFTGVLVLNNKIATSHVGDSRAVLIRGGEMTALTLDHSLVASLVRVGQMTEEEAAISEDKNVLVRCIDARVPMDESGFDSLAAVGYEDAQLTVHSGDKVILFSDGVWGVLEDETLLELATSEDNPQRLADRIVDEALTAGSNDNATVLVIAWS